MFEAKYYTQGNGHDINLSPEEAKRVFMELEENYGERSKPTGYGRKYYVLGRGVAEHYMGPQPALVIKSPDEGGLKRIVKEFKL